MTLKTTMLLFLLSVCGFSQTQQPLKVGVVLSGGGAKGFAHIGVLKVLEEAGVEVSYIGGTSMGSIIGGLYASGYRAHQIDSIFTATDFDALLQDYIPRSSKSFYGKRNDELYALTLPFNRFKIGIPRALSKGMYNYNLLARLTHPVRHVRDFSKLPIPFLCIATDIETGQRVVLNSGYLAQAMAASSAFPSLFSPVEIDGRLLIDGGVTDNYPIEEIKAMGADVIIGVDVQDDLKDREGLRDATRILVQISNLTMIERMKGKIAETDVYIKPDIKDFGVISFDEGQRIIANGEAAARKQWDKLVELGTRSSGHMQKLRETKADSLTIDNISTPKLENYTRAYILGKLRFKPGQRIGYDDLKTGIDNLSGTQNFSAITYTLEPGSKGGDDLRLTLKENEVRTNAKFGFHYDGLFKTGVLANLTHKKLLFKNDVVSFDMILGDNIRYYFDYYIDNGFYFSFGLKSRFTGFSRNVGIDFNKGNSLRELGLNTLNVSYNDVTNQAYLQTLFIQKFLLGAGVEHKYLHIESKTIESDNPVFDHSHYLSLFGYLKYDSFDKKYFPKKGWYVQGDAQWFLKSTDYTGNFERFSVLKGDAGIAYTFAQKWTVVAQTEAGFTLGERSVPVFDFILGGYGFNPFVNVRPFYGYDFLSISGNSYIKSTLTLDWEFYRRNHFNLAANMASIEDNLFERANWPSADKLFGFAAGYGMETILGPAEIKYSWSPDTRKGYLWFSIGFWF